MNEIVEPGPVLCYDISMKAAPAAREFAVLSAARIDGHRDRVVR